MRHRLLFALFFAALLSACAVTQTQEPAAEQTADTPPEPEEIVDPFESVERAAAQLIEPVQEADDPPDLWERITSRFELTACPADSTARQWANWYADNADYMERVFNRASPWLPDIVSEVELRDLPGELALLPIVESAYDPFAYSHGRAAGSWQFLAGTAREFGLVIDDWYDGRRDVYAATRAALDYLEFLHGFFDGSWPLAIAAYNAGPGRVSRALERNRRNRLSTRWNDLPLPRETLGYVPKLKGLSCLFADPESYGFELPEMDAAPKFEVVDLPGPTDIVIAAELADMEMAELVALNPGLSRHMTPPNGPHYLLAPPDKADELKAGVSELPPAARVVWQEIRVQRGNTLSGLARRHNTTVAALKEHNQLNGDGLSIGQVLRLPAADGRNEDPAYAARYKELARLQQRLLPEARFHHRVSPGESLWVIARRYNVRVEDIRRWNGFSGNMIRPGQRLTIHGAGSAGAGTLQYTVRSGDSLWTIARRHQVALKDLMRWNSLSSNSVLRPGQRLTIRQGG